MKENVSKPIFEHGNTPKSHGLALEYESSLLVNNCSIFAINSLQQIHIIFQQRIIVSNMTVQRML